MSSPENKEIFARNLRKWLKASGKSRIQACRELGVAYSTFSEWLAGSKYPRIDRVEELAQYFGVRKSDLIEPPAQPGGLTRRDERDIGSILAAAREQLETQEGLMFDGDPASPEAVESILSAMELGLQAAKQRNKEKYTPKKYREC